MKILNELKENMMLNPTTIGKKLGFRNKQRISGRQVNELLHKAGLQYKKDKKWITTDQGKQCMISENGIIHERKWNIEKVEHVLKKIMQIKKQYPYVSI